MLALALFHKQPKHWSQHIIHVFELHNELVYFINIVDLMILKQYK